jgi:hypothetical protein
LKTQLVRRGDRAFIENKSKFVLCKASSGHKHALEEIFSDPNVASQLQETKVAKEVRDFLFDTVQKKVYIPPIHSASSLVLGGNTSQIYANDGHRP